MATLVEPKAAPKTQKQFMDEAFVEATRGIASDLPMLIYGAGGGIVDPLYESGFGYTAENRGNDDVDPNLAALASSDTRQLVATLTAQYIQRLVDAALDARDMLLSGDKSVKHDTRHWLPPPPLESLHRPRSTVQTDSTVVPVGKPTPRKRRVEVISNWDDPLPQPKIRGRTGPAAGSNPPRGEGSSSSTLGGRNGNDNEDWTGLVGVDVWHNARARSVYARGLTAQQFIFPLCHDAYVYGRIREVQATKLSVLEPVLHDTTIWDTVRAEGQLQHEEAVRKRRQLRKKKKQSKKSAKPQKTSDDEDDEDADESNQSDSEEEEVAGWPGLDKLLPANREFKL
jgi:Protein of unknown function (DUF1168)